MKILLLDIENSPHTVFEYDLWGRSHYVPPSAFKQAGDILCFSAKWLGSNKVMFYSVHHHGKQEMIEQAWRLLDEADAVVHYNGKAHDIPHLNREFLLAALGPPSPYRHIDLFTVVKRNFKFPYRSLDYVSKALGIGEKIKHQGMELYIQCAEGDEKAWRIIKRYNKQDVLLLEPLYEYLLPWIPNHPSFAAEAGRSDVCPKCRSTDLERRGYNHTLISKFQRFRCRNCGSWSQSTVRESGVTVKEAS